MLENTQIKGKENKQIQNDNLQQHVKSSNEKTTITLESGKTAITMQGGYEYPIMFKEVLAGEYIKEWKTDNLTRLLTPFVPTMDKVYLTIKAYFVPHTRVLKNFEQNFANKSDKRIKVSALPNTNLHIGQTQKDTFKNSLAARYGVANNTSATINLLPMRGYRAITNDYIISKDYETPYTEWNDEVPVTAEINALNAFNPTGGYIAEFPMAYVLTKAQTRKGYTTNLKSKVAGTEDTIDAGDNQSEHLDWQTKFQQLKQQQDNVNKNDWDIIAEMGGTKPVKTDRTEYLGQIEYQLNYQQITQSAPQISGSSPLGTSGAFSYTRADGVLFSHKEFKQHGFIHILASITIDKLYENAVPKELLKTKFDDIYKPALAKKEIQLLLKQEINADPASTSGQTLAFQPPWAEYKRLPSYVTGEMRTRLLEATGSNPTPVTNSQWHNFIARDSEVVISGDYFRNSLETNTVLGRNNILSPSVGEYKIDPIMNMSEHTVTVSLPIVNEALLQNTKAEKAR